MAEAKPRPSNFKPRTRTRSDDLPEDERDLDRDTPPTAAAPEEAPRPPFDDENTHGFDAEVNSRYEEIKRGSTHISELQQMTIPQLLKVAKEEGLTDYTGMKKQDLIFKILKDRVKQNGL